MPRDLPVITLQDVLLSDIQGMRIKTDPVKATFQYQVRDQDDEQYSIGRYVSDVPNAIKQALIQWLNDDVLPAINEQEGM